MTPTRRPTTTPPAAIVLTIRDSIRTKSPFCMRPTGRSVGLKFPMLGSDRGPQDAAISHRCSVTRNPEVAVGAEAANRQRPIVQPVRQLRCDKLVRSGYVRVRSEQETVQESAYS